VHGSLEEVADCSPVSQLQRTAPKEPYLVAVAELEVPARDDEITSQTKWTQSAKTMQKQPKEKQFWRESAAHSVMSWMPWLRGMAACTMAAMVLAAARTRASLGRLRRMRDTSCS
jgi:hypothetical protein